MANYGPLASSPPSSARNVRRLANKAVKAVMKSHKVTLPKYNLPVRLRPWFLLLTFAIMLMLAFFGLTDVTRSLPLNDKFLRLTCFCVVTAVFYFIFDVEEEARRVWFWRHANLIFTAVVCFFIGGLVSEILQSLLPHQHFDLGDVVANFIGSAIGLYTSYHVEKHYRSRREIARLYRPLSTDDTLDPEDYLDDEAGPSGTQLIPLFHSQTTGSPAKPPLPSKAKAVKADRLGDIWDEREELFGIGDDSDTEDTPVAGPPTRPDVSPHAGPVPTITITRF